MTCFIRRLYYTLQALPWTRKDVLKVSSTWRLKLNWCLGGVINSNICLRLSHFQNNIFVWLSLRCLNRSSTQSKTKNIWGGWSCLVTGCHESMHHSIRFSRFLQLLAPAATLQVLNVALWLILPRSCRCTAALSQPRLLSVQLVSRRSPSERKSNISLADCLLCTRSACGEKAALRGSGVADWWRTPRCSLAGNIPLCALRWLCVTPVSRCDSDSYANYRCVLLPSCHFGWL